MRQGGRRALLLALAGASFGCAGSEGGSGNETPAVPVGDTASPRVPGADRPEVVEGVLNLEGIREPMTYHLYRSPPGFRLPFSTYVPADLRARDVSSGDSEAVRFVAAFGGLPDEEMYLAVRVPREPLTTDRARGRARVLADSLGRAEPGEREWYPWALEWYRVERAGGRVARVALGRHLDRFFFVVVHYPAEAGDGFEPRARRVLDQWRWADGGGLGT